MDTDTDTDKAVRIKCTGTVTDGKDKWGRMQSKSPTLLIHVGFQTRSTGMGTPMLLIQKSQGTRGLIGLLLGRLRGPMGKRYIQLYPKQTPNSKDRRKAIAGARMEKYV